MNRSPSSVSSRSFYREYHGHKVNELERILRHVRERGGDDGVAFLAGDSSLDNKYWFDNVVDAIEPYKSILRPSQMKPDIAYWLTMESQRRGVKLAAAINGAVEESTVGDRWCGSLLPQDRFIRDNITTDDILIVSVGGNDIALKPAPCTIVNMLGLICCTPTICVENACGAPLPCDDCCCGCGFGCLSDATACPPCAGYFAHLFQTRVGSYIRRMTSKTKPKAVLICMIYYPDEKQSGSWADGTLGVLGYNSDPAKLQLLIRKVFEMATSRIEIPGTHVIPVPLFRALDGRNTNDYCARVEPSVSGGRKMANLILDKWEQGAESTPDDRVESKAVVTGFAR